MHTQIPLYIGITQYNKHYQWRLLVSYAVYSERRQRDKGGREVSSQKFYAFDFLSFVLSWYIYIYIYILDPLVYLFLSLSLYIYIYMYIFLYIHIYIYIIHHTPFPRNEVRRPLAGNLWKTWGKPKKYTGNT